MSCAAAPNSCFTRGFGICPKASYVSEPWGAEHLAGIVWACCSKWMSKGCEKATCYGVASQEYVGFEMVSGVALICRVKLRFLKFGVRRERKGFTGRCSSQELITKAWVKRLLGIWRSGYMKYWGKPDSTPNFSLKYAPVFIKASNNLGYTSEVRVLHIKRSKLRVFIVGVENWLCRG